MKRFTVGALVAAGILASSSAWAVSSSTLSADIRAAMQAGQTQQKAAAKIVEELGTAALLAGVSADEMVRALRAQSVAEADISTGLLNAGYPPNDVTNATAAGNQGQGQGNAGFAGNSSFGQSRASTVGGGGGNGVSRS